MFLTLNLVMLKGFLIKTNLGEKIIVKKLIWASGRAGTIGPTGRRHSSTRVTLIGPRLGFASSPVGRHGMTRSMTGSCLGRGWEGTSPIVLGLDRAGPAQWPGIAPGFLQPLPIPNEA
jgi:hypothetical protein